ncbi:Nuclease SbcCD subunit C [Streptomyces sp. YIM 130001]|uniref:AAA family ATPase n=1 Tax=Streptomyces sp. YIM 130001 TaxID=2259644 RepID=UPI000E647B23|nr:SMC family ATPase [Streptomyces sp. YIM 130001]RII13956.1 Nuclease SbcCD subunit C [Streptomyces sp. YIM 130001]
MRLHRLTISAFGPFGGTQEIDFDALSGAGLFLLHGPTGAGKTSVLDAVCYALYGSVPGSRQSQSVALRSDHAPAGTRTSVTLELSVAGRRLEVTRQPARVRPKKRGTGTTVDKAQTWLRTRDAVSGAWQDLSRSHQEIGEEVGRLLGMSKEQFCQVVLLPQGEFARFLRADAEARGRVLGRLFDTRRFAAVEDKLAELRRATQARVQSGDDRLLAVAHRIQQAAGPAAELPLPDTAPGEPGLADDVLGWAAVARAGARERRTLARTRVAEAERVQAAARRELDAELATHRLQQRAAEARARAEALAAGDTAYAELRARMERGRKAETVAPALRLRADAEREHRGCTTAEERARAALPADLAGAGAATLASAARKALEELGGLESARRAEQRLAALTEERAGLDREERADDEALRDVTEWLDRADATHHSLRGAVDSARDAVARAEHLAAALSSAQDRLAAAARRDELAVRAEQCEHTALRTREAALAAHEHWLGLKEQRLRGIAAELAAGLEPGTACAVCGSTDHPDPATKVAGHVDRGTEEAAFAAHGSADERRQEAERELSAVSAALAAAVEATGDDTTAELASTVEQLRREHADVRDRAAGLHAAQEALAHAEEEHARRLSGRERALTRIASRQARTERLDRERADVRSELAEARGDAESVAARAGQLERQADLLTAAADAVRAAADAAQRLKDADSRLADAAYRAGFDTPRQAAEAALDDAAHRELQHRIDRRQQEEAAVRAVLAEDETLAAEARPAADPDTARSRADTADRVLRDTVSADDAAAGRCTELDRLSTHAQAEARQLGPLRTEYDRVARLAGLAAGTASENERRMRLESYVLAARLEQVAAAATARLQRMSAGRYTLVHSDDRAGRGRSGLGLHVVDAWTGRERDTATLSGGETFFASLALALGLADVVTDEAGGVRLDTLFIDEGFGSLDDQTLDEVLDVLDSLRERDRSVGIVSHVPDLRRRVHAQLEVVKHRDGSTLRQRTAAA